MDPHRPKSRLSRSRLALLLVIAVSLGAGLGYLSSADKSLPQLTRHVRHRIGLAGTTPATPGQWGVYEAPVDESRLDPAQAAEVRRLRSLGYAGGTVTARRSAGVTHHHTDFASRGLRLYTSGHAPSAFLMDPGGRILHTWRLTYQEFIAQSGLPPTDFLADPNGVTNCWRRFQLLPDGEMMVIFEGHGLARIDRDSRVIWSYPGHCHHDLEVDDDGSIFVLTRETELVPEINADNPVLADYITHLSPTGEFLGSIDLFTAFANSVYASCLDHMADAGDIFHTNTLEILDGKAAQLSPAFAKGNFLISLRELGVIAVVDHRTEKVVWALSGMWSSQHQPTLLENGNILLFDNQGHGGRSKVIEFNPFTQDVNWSFTDSPAHPLFSKTCGSCQRLPGGNTLITESDNGRALEVAPDGRIVWEFRNPERTGKNQEFIASIMEMVILPDDFSPSWLGRPQ